MAFQDNSGDIILDIVLTDEGRKRLAAGNTSFHITQFALGDDEINYGLFNTGSTTALQDLSILQTPVLEAFTNNGSSLKSKLLWLPNPNLLYLPVLRLNEIVSPTNPDTGNYVVLVDQSTTDDTVTSNAGNSIGYVQGSIVDGMIFGTITEDLGSYIRIDSGIDTEDATEIDSSLIEQEFQIEMDHRFGTIVSRDGIVAASPIAIDDDNIATYILRREPGSQFVKVPSQSQNTGAETIIRGPLSSYVEFKIRSTESLRNNNFLFNRLGSTTTSYKKANNTSQTTNIIDSIVKITGLTTGYSVDIPVRYAKI